MLRGGTALITSSTARQRLLVDIRELHLSGKVAELGSHRSRRSAGSPTAPRRTPAASTGGAPAPASVFPHRRRRPDRRDASARAADALVRDGDPGERRSARRETARRDDRARTASESLVIAITTSMLTALILPPNVVGERRRTPPPEPVGLEVFRVVVNRDIGARHQDLSNGGVQHRVRGKELASPNERSAPFGTIVPEPGRRTDPQRCDGRPPP